MRINLITASHALLAGVFATACGTPAPASSGAKALADAGRAGDTATPTDAVGGADTGVQDGGGQPDLDGAAAVADAPGDTSTAETAAETKAGDALGADTGRGPTDTGKDTATAPDAGPGDLAPSPDATPDAPGDADSAAEAPMVIPMDAPTIGKCKPGAPGFDSCIVQAIFQCVQPTTVCAATVTAGGASETKWQGGGSFACSVDEKAGLATCNGSGPDGKPCAQFTLMVDGATQTAAATLTAGGAVHTMAFADKGITVTCAGGKVEVYANEGDLCALLKATKCESDPIGPPPDPCPMPPPPCKPGGFCGSSVCDAATNTCLVPCAPDGSCPPCSACDGGSGLCKP
ncbi:MAG: hypothetical protein EXR79_05385 [Myxococcales bacterium]|nr:hypothetical protein [Myxococcales bacterium]